MKTAFYPKLAADGMIKNKKMYLPYTLTCVFMVAMYYIIAFLRDSRFINSMKGGRSTTTVLSFGVIVIAVFALIFLFYTNSFLIRRRKKEFGLYNILGMDKHSIGKILAWETLFVTVISLIAGIAVGIAFSKLAELLLSNMIGNNVSLGFSLSGNAIVSCIIIFAVIFILIFLNGIRQVHFSNPIELLRSESAGEKAPKANWVFGLLGVILLAGAYYIAVSIENPIDAFSYFFIAVILVIIGTYMSFISGSVLLCRILQKNKQYYYKKQHFVSLSYMVYRMKRNGAGLASICILLTMVFVMISSTSCMYFGKEDGLKRQYPSSIMIELYFEKDSESETDEDVIAVEKAVNEVIDSFDVQVARMSAYRNVLISGYMENGIIETDISKVNMDLAGFENVYNVFIIPESDYCRMTGEEPFLKKGEAIAYSPYVDKFSKIAFSNGTEFSAVKTIDELYTDGTALISTVKYVYLITPDFVESVKPLADYLEQTSGYFLQQKWICGIDLFCDTQTELAVKNAIEEKLVDMAFSEGNVISSPFVSCIDEARESFYGTYAGFFFLGISLSLVFIIAAVLIIYYKQICEGFEDKAKYGIMQKIGLTRTDIKKSINSQMLTVFFAPVIFSVLHMAFAFPMIYKLLMLFGISNLGLLIATTGISIAVFAVIYAAVYKITSNAYYSIVSDKE